MGTVSTQLGERARSIFNNLGYTVVGDGHEFRAKRDWKIIDVTVTETLDELPTAGSLRCFVTPKRSASELRRHLRQIDPEYEWAIISVDDEDYRVERAPPGPSALT